MKRVPTHAAIYAAELRVASARVNITNSARRTRTAFRSMLARPSTIGLVAGAAALVGFWLGHRADPVRDAPPEGALPLAAVSGGGVALALAIRFAKHLAPYVFQQFRQAWQERAEYVRAGSPDSSGEYTTRRVAPSNSGREHPLRL